jgi:hypothetical protein
VVGVHQAKGASEEEERGDYDFYRSSKKIVEGKE